METLSWNYDETNQPTNQAINKQAKETLNSPCANE